MATIAMTDCSMFNESNIIHRKKATNINMEKYTKLRLCKLKARITCLFNGFLWIFGAMWEGRKQEESEENRLERMEDGAGSGRERGQEMWDVGE